MEYKKITPLSYVPGEGLGGSKEHFQSVKKVKTAGKLLLRERVEVAWHGADGRFA